MQNSFDKEQYKIVELVKESTVTKKGERFIWNRFNGNAACNVVKKYLEEHVRGKGLRVVKSAFIKSLPTEFDLLIVDEDARPEDFTDAYDPKSVRFVIEVKSHGTISEKALVKYRKLFDKLSREYSIKCIYLAIRESGSPKKAGSKNWVNITRSIIQTKKPHPVFVLADSRTKQIYTGQWMQLINCILTNKT